METHTWFFTAVFQVIVLGVFAFVLKMLLKPGNPKTNMMTVELCNEKMCELYRRIEKDIQKIERDIETLSKAINELNKKVDSLILQLVKAGLVNGNDTD